LSSPLLLTRPSTASNALILLCKELGFVPFVSPLMQIEPTAISLSLHAAQDGVLLTSANAVQPLAESTPVRDMPCVTVGPQTAAAAKEHGFLQVVDASQGRQIMGAMAIEQMARENINQWLGRHWWYFSAEKVHRDLSETFKAIGLNCERVIAYRSVPVEPWPTPEVAQAWEQMQAMVFFSKEAVRVFTHHCRVLELKTPHMVAGVLSHAVAAEVESLGFREVVVAPRPESGALLSALKQCRLLQDSFHKVRRV